MNENDPQSISSEALEKGFMLIFAKTLLDKRKISLTTYRNIKRALNKEKIVGIA